MFENLLKKSIVFILFFVSFSLYASANTQNIEQYSKKQKERLLKRGKKIYENICSKVDIESYNSLEELKKDLSKNSICGKQKKKNIIAVSYYLWESKSGSDMAITSSKIKVPKDAKCPVCGMFVHKYPKWAAKMEIGDHTHYFDGVKDMMKFYFYPNSYGHKHNKGYEKKMYVSDYYTLNQIDAKKAWYVIGSNVYGPMGHELIAFKAKKDAEVFLKNHYAKRILSFKEIDEELTFGLDK